MSHCKAWFCYKPPHGNSIYCKEHKCPLCHEKLIIPCGLLVSFGLASEHLQCTGFKNNKHTFKQCNKLIVCNQTGRYLRHL